MFVVPCYVFFPILVGKDGIGEVGVYRTVNLPFIPVVGMFLVLSLDVGEIRLRVTEVEWQEAAEHQVRVDCVRTNDRTIEPDDEHLLAILRHKDPSHVLRRQQWHIS